MFFSELKKWLCDNFISTYIPPFLNPAVAVAKEEPGMIGMLFCQNIQCPILMAVNVTLHVTMHVSLQLRQALDALLNDMKNLPARLKQYSSFEYVQKTIKTYLKVSNTMSFPTSRIDGIEPVNRDDVGRECFFSFVSLEARRTVHNRVV